MAYKGALMVDDETLFRTMQVAADTGALVMVHAENGDAIDVLVKEALAAGKTEPKYHALTRPPETEGEATNRAIQLARVAGCNLYVVHVSCKEAIDPIARAREAGWNAWGETCTQYFFIDYTYLEKPDFEGAKYVYTPPPRAKENQELLWAAVRSDVLSAISTDHCAFRWDGQKTAGRDDFSKIPNGGPGLENRLQMIHEFGARAGRISLNRMVELLATNPAKLFGLYPRKGTIAVGSDADIVVFDPEKRVTITAATQHSKSDYNLYEGVEVTGSPEVVIRRGEVLVDGDELVARPGLGPVPAPRPLRGGAEGDRCHAVARGYRPGDERPPSRSPRPASSSPCSPSRAARRASAPLPAVDRFDGARAFAFLRWQVKLGPRPAGSTASRALAERLKRELPNGRFQAVPGGLRNVIGTVPGREPRRVVVVGAHYDTKDLPDFVGANDGAAGTAIVAELARTLKPRTLRPTVVFILFDGEESPRDSPPGQFEQDGLRGSKVAAPTFRRRGGDDPRRPRRRQAAVDPARGELDPAALGPPAGRVAPRRHRARLPARAVRAACSTTTSRSSARACPRST